MKTVTIKAFKEILNAERKNDSVAFINVCTPLEYKQKHIAGVESMPLDELEYRSRELLGKKTIYVHCRSGNRSAQAIQKLKKMGIAAEFVNVDGGILAWEGLNFPTKSLSGGIPIVRQVFITAGLLILTGSVLALTVNTYFMILPIFIACGLIFAGITGWCGMAILLAKLPWNK